MQAKLVNETGTDETTALKLELNERTWELEQLLKDADSKPYPVPEHDPETEKWIDLDGTQSIFLRVTYTAHASESALTDINFFNVTSKQEASFVSAPHDSNLRWIWV